MRLLRDTLRVARRETASYLVQPLFYVLSGVFFLLAAYVFLTLLITFANETFRTEAQMSINVTQGVIRQTFYVLHFFLLVQVPLLTMRSFAEERATGMLDLLQTTPLHDWALLLGKYLGCLMAMGFYLLLSLAFPLAVWFVGEPEWGVVISGFGALLLATSAYVAVGLFCSSLTESQVVAAVLGYVSLFGLMIGSTLRDVATSDTLADAARHFSVVWHLEELLRGSVAPMNVAYFVLLTALFLFLTARVLEARRWRG